MGLRTYEPLLLDETEQVVLALQGRILPSVSDFFLLLLFTPALVAVVWVSLHRLFRPVTYIITTQRVLAVEPQGIAGEIQIRDIQRIRSARRAMMIRGASHRLWLARLPDAWHFETVIGRVRQRG